MAACRARAVSPAIEYLQDIPSGDVNTGGVRDDNGCSEWEVA